MTRFCPSCHKTILPGSLTTQIMNNDYHSSCLYCFKCGKSLWEKGFVKRQDGKLQCEEANCEENGPQSDENKVRNQHANTFSVYNQFQYANNGVNGQQNGNMPGDFTNSYKNLELTPRKNSVPQNIQSYNLGKYLQDSKKNENNGNNNLLGVVESTPHQIETYPVQQEATSQQRPESRRSSAKLEKTNPNACSKCNNPLKANEKFAYDNRLYHKECLTCDSCQTELYRMKKIQRDEASGKNYCEPCFSEIYGPKCGKCNKPVTEYQFSSKYDDKLYHKECFLCGRCKKSLDKKEFKKIGNLVVCKDCL